MPWNLHHYYANRTDGLIGKLLLTEQENASLITLRQMVRRRTKEVFSEAQAIARDIRKSLLTEAGVLTRLQSTRIHHLSPTQQHEVAILLREMDDEARDEFLSLQPRFWTQGSFQYNTLNRPFQAPQEMDIDDGTYLPMTVFDSEPRIGHKLLLLLVDSSLKSLVAENKGWVFEAKQTCARIKIPNRKVHIDVPMYAIPKDQFEQKQVANESFTASMAKSESLDALQDLRDSYEVDSDCVNLALRTGPKRWTNSDPKVVEDWFHDNCRRIGSHLSKACRFLKAWRDAQWDVGGPTSISLMAAAVNVLNTYAPDRDDLSKTMKTLAKHLPNEFSRGIESPDSSDEKPLFSPAAEHGPRELDIMEKLNALHTILLNAETAQTKQEALCSINGAYGDRVTKSDLIVSAPAAPAFFPEPERSATAGTISSTMTSG